MDCPVDFFINTRVFLNGATDDSEIMAPGLRERVGVNASDTVGVVSKSYVSRVVCSLYWHLLKVKALEGAVKVLIGKLDVVNTPLRQETSIRKGAAGHLD
jgi:hypothetical protein